MVFVNEDFAVDESFENFIAQNMRIETIYRQSHDRSIRSSLSTPRPLDSPRRPDSPRPNTPLPDLYVERFPGHRRKRHFDEIDSVETETLNSEDFLEMLNNARIMDSMEFVEFVWQEETYETNSEEAEASDSPFEDDLTLDDFDTAEFDSNAEFELLDPWENHFFELINLFINCLRFIITL